MKKPSVSVIINLCCGDSVCLCSMNFVSGSNIEIFKNAAHSRNRFNGQCMRQVARSACTSYLSLFRYIWVLIKHCTIVWWPTSLLVLWYRGQATVHAPLTTLLQEKFVERKSCERTKQ